MKVIKNNGFLEINNKNYEVLFSTAENNRNFNRHTLDGVKEINSLKNEFSVKEVIYLKQIHSDKVIKYDGLDKETFINYEGDAIITNEKNIAIGIFTADCVPIIIVDEKNQVSAAIHSGWKGTYNSIVLNTIDMMKKEYSSKVDNLKVYIGPHIRKCCYEVSKELKDKFIEKTMINKEKLFEGRKLSLEECILNDLSKVNIKKENIFSLELCTYCSKDIKLHSYRKSKGDYGRLFTFIVLR